MGNNDFYVLAIKKHDSTTSKSEKLAMYNGQEYVYVKSSNKCTVVYFDLDRTTTDKPENVVVFDNVELHGKNKDEICYLVHNLREDGLCINSNGEMFPFGVLVSSWSKLETHYFDKIIKSINKVIAYENN
ncbi:MAG: hypothetical protein J6V23_05190 [Bacteroidaceae bacterium]|nr:hypothetical protein [Bacteroidaceae bacterium]